MWNGERRYGEIGKSLFDFLGPEKSLAVRGICYELWQPYIGIINDQAWVALVFAKILVVLYLIEPVDWIWRDVVREKRPAYKALMYKTRLICLKRSWNLNKKQARHVGEFGRLHVRINWPYLLREFYRHFLDYRRSGWSRRFLRRWFWWATHSRFAPPGDFAWMVCRHGDEFLNHFRMPIDYGTVVGLKNNKAKLAIHKGCGLRAVHNYIRNLYHCVGDIP